MSEIRKLNIDEETLRLYFGCYCHLNELERHHFIPAIGVMHDFGIITGEQYDECIELVDKLFPVENPSGDSVEIE